MLNIVLFGPPGAGKGTQSKLLIEKYKLMHLSTGDILRGEISKGTELGLKAKSIMDKGDLVPDEVVIGMIESILSNNQDVKGFIFDGFPRTSAQAKALDQLLSKLGTSISAMLSLEIKSEELVERLLERGKQSGRADDQNRDIISNRISEYNSKTAPLQDYYLAQNKLVSINGVGTIEDINNKLCAAIDKI